MAYIVSTGEKSFTVAADCVEKKPHENVFEVSVDDEVKKVSIARISPTHLSILVDNTSYNVEVSKLRDEYEVTVRGELFRFRVSDEREMAAAALHETGEIAITAPMPGMVIDVMVKPGQDVHPGDKLLILEAMKMQNEISAPRGGKIAAIKVEPGSSVGGGEELVLLE
ncbi:biotin/lipoyl-binding protein [Candidatus Fermentibacteria bacterium]|nr:biotin/lipoyl-binding protein [Candidatus Fermentibacteria bacterium]